MKIVVTGSLGHISKPLTVELVQQGHDVSVISSNPEKQTAIEALGAAAVIGSVGDINFLTNCFKGVDAVYTMIPPANYFDQKLDLEVYIYEIANCYVQALKASAVKRVVHLSSIGAHLEQGTGIITTHYQVEKLLDQLKDTVITFMRPTAFYYNLYGFVRGIKSTGSMSANYGGTDKMVWVAPEDIATAIAEEIITTHAGRKIRYVASEELTCNEVASILGKEIEIPDLKWNTISQEQMQTVLKNIGMQPAIAEGFAEMQSSMHNGEFFQDYYLHRQPLGKTKMTRFAKEFAAAFKQQ